MLVPARWWWLVVALLRLLRLVVVVLLLLRRLLGVVVVGGGGALPASPSVSAAAGKLTAKFPPAELSQGAKNNRKLPRLVGSCTNI
jgi:hypothetical protein